MEVLLYEPYARFGLSLMLGLFVGSFINVVVYRLPRLLDRGWRQECMELLGIPPADPAADPPLGLAWPGSRCPACGHALRPWENIPIVSYVFLRGRCSACRASISLRYPFTEALSAILTLAVVYRFGPTWAALAALTLTWTLLALSLIDFDTQLLPDDITLPILWLGLLVNTQALFTDLTSAVLGAAAGYLTLWIVYKLFKAVTGKEGMGYGDFKLLALLGAWLGWEHLPLTILLSASVGALVGLSLILLGRHKRQLPIPFGPYLAVAGWINLLWGEQILRFYLLWAGHG